MNYINKIIVAKHLLNKFIDSYRWFFILHNMLNLIFILLKLFSFYEKKNRVLNIIKYERKIMHFVILY